MSSPYTAKIEMHIKAYKKACSRTDAESPELRRARILAPTLCLRAKSAKKNIASYGELSGKDARAFLLAEEFLSSGATVGEEELLVFLAEKGEKFGAVMLSLLPDAIFASIFANISRLFCKGEGEEISRYIFAAEKLRFIDFTRIFLAFSSSVHIFSQEKCGIFLWCDDKTKLKYISALVTLCKKEGRGEEELAKDLVAQVGS